MAIEPRRPTDEAWKEKRKRTLRKKTSPNGRRGRVATPWMDRDRARKGERAPAKAPGEAAVGEALWMWREERSRVVESTDHEPAVRRHEKKTKEEDERGKRKKKRARMTRFSGLTTGDTEIRSPKTRNLWEGGRDYDGLSKSK